MKLISDFKPTSESSPPKFGEQRRIAPPPHSDTTQLERRTIEKLGSVFNQVAIGGRYIRLADTAFPLNLIACPTGPGELSLALSGDNARHQLLKIDLNAGKSETVLSGGISEDINSILAGLETGTTSKAGRRSVLADLEAPKNWRAKITRERSKSNSGN